MSQGLNTFNLGEAPFNPQHVKLCYCGFSSVSRGLLLGSLTRTEELNLRLRSILGPPPAPLSINQARVTPRGSPGGVVYLTPGRPLPAHRKAGSVQRSPWRRRGGADASRPPSRSRLGCRSWQLPHRKRPRARAGRQLRVPHAGRGRRAGPPPPGGARGPGGAAVPSGERWLPPRPPGSFPPRPPHGSG